MKLQFINDGYYKVFYGLSWSFVKAKFNVIWLIRQNKIFGDVILGSGKVTHFPSFRLYADRGGTAKTHLPFTEEDVWVTKQNAKTIRVVLNSSPLMRFEG